MQIGLIGKKVGMTRIFTDSGDSLPVTLIDVSNNRISQIKTKEVDGYTAIQLTYGIQKTHRVSKAKIGHFTKAKIEIGQKSKEFRLIDKNVKDYQLGEAIEPSLFTVGDNIDVTGRSIGKGYAGTIKKHNFSSNRASHGNSKSHRVPGSISMAQDPGRVFPGKKMTGRLGGGGCTVQNLEVLKIDNEKGLLFVKGSIPGHTNSIVFIKKSVKGVVIKS